MAALHADLGQCSEPIDTTVWFDRNRNFVMAELPIAGRKVLVKLDPS